MWHMDARGDRGCQWGQCDDMRDAPVNGHQCVLGNSPVPISWVCEAEPQPRLLLERYHPPLPSQLALHDGHSVIGSGHLSRVSLVS